MGGTFSYPSLGEHKIVIDDSVFISKKTQKHKSTNKPPVQKLSPKFSPKLITKNSELEDNKDNSLTELSNIMNIYEMGVTIDSKNGIIDKDLKKKYKEQNKSIDDSKAEYYKQIVKYQDIEEKYNNYIYYKNYMLFFLIVLIIFFAALCYLLIKRKYSKLI
jgi:hypothetical protein